MFGVLSELLVGLIGKSNQSEPERPIPSADSLCITSSLTPPPRLEYNELELRSIVIDVSQPLHEMKASYGHVKTTRIATLTYADRGTLIGSSTSCVAYTTTEGRVRVISRLNSAENTFLQLPQCYPRGTQITDIAVRDTRLAGITSDGGLVIWELPEIISEGVASVVSLCVLSKNDRLRMVKWHPKKREVFVVASESRIYHCHMPDMVARYTDKGSSPLVQADLQRCATVLNTPHLIAFDLGFAMVTISGDSVFNVWDIPDKQPLWSCQIPGDGHPSSIKFLDNLILLGRRNDTIFQLLSIGGKCLLSTIKFVNGANEDPGMFGRVAWDSCMQTLWITNNRRWSILAFRLTFESRTGGGEEIGHFNPVVEFPGLSPTMNLVISTVEHDPVKDVAVACVSANDIPNEPALVAFAVHFAGVDQVLITREWYNSALRIQSPSLTGKCETLAGSPVEVSQAKPEDPRGEAILGPTALSPDTPFDSVRSPESPTEFLFSSASVHSLDSSRNPSTPPPPPVTPPQALTDAKSSASKPAGSSFRSRLGTALRRTSSFVPIIRPSAGTRASSGHSSLHSAGSWSHSNILEHASIMTPRDDADLANRLKQDVIIDFDVFLTKMVLERPEPHVPFDFAINIIRGLANRPLYGFDESENGYGSAPLELQLRTISTALQLIRVLGTKVDHDTFRRPILEATAKLEKATKDLLSNPNPNIRFLCQRIRKDSLAVKNNRSKLKVAGRVGLALSSAALHLYGKRLPDAIDQLMSIQTDVGIAWDALLNFFETLKGASEGGSPPLDWEAAMKDLKDDCSFARTSPEFLKLFDSFKPNSYFLSLELLDALETNRSSHEQNDDTTLEAVASIVQSVLDKHMHDVNSQVLLVHAKAFEVLISLRSFDGGEFVAKDALAAARLRYVEINQTVKPEKLCKLLQEWDDRVKQAECYCAQRDRLYEQVVSTYAHITLNLIPSGSTTAVFSSGARKVFQCPISGRIMIDAVVLNCGHHVSAGAYAAAFQDPSRNQIPDVPSRHWGDLKRCCTRGETIVIELRTLRRLAVQYLTEVADLDELEFWELLDIVKGALEARTSKPGLLEGIALRMAIASSRSFVENLLLHFLDLADDE